MLEKEIFDAEEIKVNIWDKIKNYFQLKNMNTQCLYLMLFHLKIFIDIS